MVGSVDPFSEESEEKGERKVWSTMVEWTSMHGDRRLGDFAIEVGLTAPTGGDRDGYGVRVLRMETEQGLHGRIKVFVDQTNQVTGEGPTRQGRISIDVLLVAGAGDSTVSIVAGTPQQKMPRLVTDMQVWRMLTGLMSPLDDPPDEGWWQHIRTRFSTSQYWSGNGGGGIGYNPEAIEKSTDNYSSDVKWRVRDLRNGFEGTVIQGHIGLSWTWNGEVR